MKGGAVLGLLYYLDIPSMSLFLAGQYIQLQTLRLSSPIQITSAELVRTNVKRSISATIKNSARLLLLILNSSGTKKSSVDTHLNNKSVQTPPLSVMLAS